MIGDLIGEWIKGILIDGIMGNLSGLFNTVNTKVGEIASDVGSTPQDWNGGIFSMLQNLSETVIVPIAAAILALVMCYELIDMIVEKNNMHDFDSSMFFRWIFKSAFAILIVTNTWNIVMGVFDATQQVVNQSAGVIIGDTSIDFDTLLPDLESRLEAMDIGPLLGLWFQTLVVGLTMNILSICIFLVTYGRMIEIYAVTALGPIPLATLGNAEWRGMGQNYLKSLLALGFQAFLIMVVVGIYAVLIQQIGTADDISGAIWISVQLSKQLSAFLTDSGIATAFSIPLSWYVLDISNKFLQFDTSGVSFNAVSPMNVPHRLCTDDGIASTYVIFVIFAKV